MSRTTRAFQVISLVSTVALIASCFVPVALPSTSLQVSVADTAYGYEATFDFGDVNVDDGPVTVTGTVINILGLDVEVAEVTAALPFAAEAPAAPFTVATAATEDVSLSFDPSEPGAAAGTLEIFISGLTDPFVLNLTGTGVTSPSAASLLALKIDSEDYASGTTYDFGLANPGAAALTAPVLLANVTGETVTVTSISAGAQGITLSLPVAPFEIAGNSEVSGTLEFDAAGSGAAVAGFNIEVEDTSGPFALNVSGEGNYPPVARVAVQVTGAGTTAANGTYYRTDELSSGYPVYRLDNAAPVIDYVIYRYNIEGFAWLIDDDLDAGTYLYDLWGGPGSAPNGTNEDWFWNSGASPAPASVGEITSQSGGVYNVPVGDVIAPNYEFDDLDGDVEGTTTYQWYRSDVQYDAASTYSALTGETGATYTVVNGDDGYSLKVLVTPVSATGITTGEPVWFGPSPEAYVPPG